MVLDENTNLPGTGNFLTGGSNAPSLSGNTVAFVVSTGVYTRTGSGPIKIVADSSTSPPGFSDTFNFLNRDQVAISGERVAFHAGSPAGNDVPLGIWMSNDADIELLVANQDEIGGEVVNGFRFSQYALDKDSFVFSARLPAPVSEDAIYLAKRISAPPQPDSACEARTDYGAGGCKGTFKARSVFDLAEYVASNFGRRGSNFKHLKITGSLGEAGEILDIASPCKIKVASNVALTGSSLSLDGRKGVVFSNNNISLFASDQACVLSGGSLKLGELNSIVGTDVFVQGKNTTLLGSQSILKAGEDLTFQSTGGRAKIDEGALLIAGE